jgi:hypothetical protein
MPKQTDAVSIYELGIWLGYLEGILKIEKLTWVDIRETLQGLGEYETVKGLEFIGTESRAEFLRLARIYKYSYHRLFAEDEKVSIKTFLHSWYGRLTEVQKKWIISSPKTHLDISKLCTGAQSYFSESEWSSLNELEQLGLNEAVACLLSNNFTACEFMALRTVESVLRRWYEIKTGKITDKQAAIFDILNEVYKEKKPKEISLLFYLKDRRNAIAHPDEISSAEEASVTFTHAIEICSYIVKSK